MISKKNIIDCKKTSVKRKTEKKTKEKLKDTHNSPTCEKTILT